jgi:hypothetical protein
MRPPQQIFNDSNALEALKTGLVYIYANFCFFFIAAYSKDENDNIFVVRNNKRNHRILDT